MTTIYLAIDPGDKRTGLAVGDDQTRIASPAGVIQTASGPERLNQIGRAIREHEANEIVLGYPLNMDGTEGPAATKAKALAEQVRRRFDVVVHLHDERLTSYEADQQMAQSGLTHRGKKNRRDALAAAVLLSDFFAQLD